MRSWCFHGINLCTEIGMPWDKFVVGINKYGVMSRGKWLGDSCIGTQKWNALRSLIIVRGNSLDMVEDKQPER